MAKHLHKRFPNEQVKSLFKRYLLHEIKIDYILEILGIKHRKVPDWQEKHACRIL